MVKTILVAIDGSATAQEGLRRAIQLAQDTGAALSILYVVDDLPLQHSIAKFYARDFVNAVIAALTAEGRQILDAAKAAAEKEHVNADTILMESDLPSVAETIVEQATKVGADLIVLGTHGRRGISRLVMGSDAELVVRRSSVPVVLVPAHLAKD
jgi:nucleotide-binding universal stress UspA family protein